MAVATDDLALPRLEAMADVGALLRQPDPALLGTHRFGCWVLVYPAVDGQAEHVVQHGMRASDAACRDDPQSVRVVLGLEHALAAQPPDPVLEPVLVDLGKQVVAEERQHTRVNPAPTKSVEAASHNM